MFTRADSLFTIILSQQSKKRGCCNKHRPKTDTSILEIFVFPIFLNQNKVGNLQTLQVPFIFCVCFLSATSHAPKFRANVQAFAGIRSSVPSTPPREPKNGTPRASYPTERLGEPLLCTSSRLPKGSLKMRRIFRDWVNTHFTTPQKKGRRLMRQPLFR